MLLTPESEGEILYHLSIISQIPEGWKLNIFDSLSFSPPSAYSSIMRRINNEGRNSLVYYLTIILDRSEKIVTGSNTSPYFIEALKSACNGINALCVTYEDDIATVTRLRMLINRIGSLVSA